MTVEKRPCVHADDTGLFVSDGSYRFTAADAAATVKREAKHEDS